MDINQPVDYYDKLYFNSRSLVGAFHRRRVGSILNAVPFGSKVLDLGCSSGFISNLLTVKKCQVTGVDIRSECIDFAKTNSNASFLTASILDLDLGETFSVVVCSDVIEHFQKEERSKVLQVIDKHLQNGGQVILTTPGILSHIIEPVWKLWRRFKNPGVVFDDEGTHELVSKLEITKALGSNYHQVKSAPICGGLVNLLVLSKV